MGRVVIGVDGGGTKTIAVALDAETGAVLGKSAAGSSNHNSVGAQRAKAALLEAIAGSLEAAAAQSSDIAAICSCAAGVDRDIDEERMRSWLAEACPHTDSARLLAFNDAVGALASGTGGELFGVVVIAGTGTVALGMDGKGSVERCSGWGPAFDDRGSAHNIGSRALAAVARAADGRGPETLILGALLTHLGLAKPEELIDWAYSSEAGAGDWARIAALAPVVTAAEKDGDAVARGILDAAADGLLDAAAVVAAKLGFCGGGGGPAVPASGGLPFTLVLAGGVLEAEGGTGAVAATFRERAAARLPSATVVAATVEMAAEGAAKVALAALRRGGEARAVAASPPALLPPAPVA